MIHRNIRRLVLAALLVLIILSGALAFAAGITNMPATHLLQATQIITVSDLAPAECDSISHLLTAYLVCDGGNCDGTPANELILGTSGVDVIDGKNGVDCIVGGDDNDRLNGGNDDDILIGGNGNDELDGGQKKDLDVCHGGAGSNTFNECDSIN